MGATGALCPTCPGVGMTTHSQGWWPVEEPPNLTTVSHSTRHCPYISQLPQYANIMYMFTLTDGHYILNSPLQGSWSISHTLLHARFEHSSWSSPDGVVLMGGRASPNTSEILSRNSSKSSTFFPLKYDIGY